MTSSRACAGQVALVTGASQGGTGTAIAIRLAAEGAAVAITARTLAGLEETRQRIEDAGGTCLVLQADLSDPAGGRGELVARTEAELGPDRHPGQQRSHGRLRPVRPGQRQGARTLPAGQSLGALGADEGRRSRHARTRPRLDPEPHVVRGGIAARAAVSDESAGQSRVSVRRDEGRPQPADRRSGERVRRARASPSTRSPRRPPSPPPAWWPPAPSTRSCSSRSRRWPRPRLPFARVIPPC